MAACGPCLRAQICAHFELPIKAGGFVLTPATAGVTREQLIFTPVHCDLETVAEGRKTTHSGHSRAPDRNQTLGYSQ